MNTYLTHMRKNKAGNYSQRINCTNGRLGSFNPVTIMNSKTMNKESFLIKEKNPTKKSNP